MHVVHLREVDAIGTSVPDWVGSRWTPHHIVRIDTERGTFEEVNGHPQPHVQVALLSKRPQGISRAARVLIWAGLLGLAVGAALALKGTT